MAQQILRQPDGKYAIWSTVVDDITVQDATREEIIQLWTEHEAKRLRKEVNNICDQLDKGGKPYFQFTMTWAEAQSESRRRRRLEKECSS